MKYLALLLALVLPLSGQTLTNTTLDGVTNATINGKLDDDVSATHAALNLGTAATAANTDFADDGAVFYAARYGVLADGTTNDTVAIQAAINAAHAAGGGMVILPAGTMRVGKTQEVVVVGDQKHAILLKQGVSLKGQGIGVSIIKPMDNVANATYDMPIIYARATSPATRITDFSISDLTVDGYKSRFGGSLGGEDECINVYGGDRVQIRNVECKNAGQNGLDFDGMSTNCTLVTIADCIVSGSMSAGIHMEVDGLVITGCVISDNGIEASAVGGGATYPHEAGIECGQSLDIIISGNHFQNNFVDVLVPSANIVGNTFLNSGRTCIKATKNSSGSIVGNRIRAYGASTAIGIDINITDPATPGSNFDILGNTIFSSGVGIKATDSGPLYIMGNTIGTNGYAVHLLNMNGHKARIIGNAIGSSNNVVRVESAGGGTITGNVLDTASGTVCIDLRSSSANWFIASNHFITSGMTGLRLFDTGSSSVIFRDNIGDFDVSLNSASNRIVGNKIRNLTVNSGTTGNEFSGNDITGTITHSTATFNSNTWRRNTGAGCAGIFYGTATLVSGTTGTPIATAAANSSRKFSLTRQAPNASTAIGNLALGTITANTSFVINALDASAATATGDLSTVYWEIIE